jgi:hypothetical protein
VVRDTSRGGLLQHVIPLYNATQRDGIEFNLAYIGSDFTQKLPAPFDQSYMRALFDYGYQRARRGYEWANSAHMATKLASAHKRRDKEVGLPTDKVEALIAGLPTSFTDERGSSMRWPWASQSRLSAMSASLT